MKLLSILVFFLSFISALSGCASTAPQSDEHWSFSVVAPEHYEVWVEHLEFEKSGVRHWRMPVGYVSCCWRGPHGPFGSGGRMAPLPNYIGIEWFSFPEQKVYQKLISLPDGLKDRMSVPAEYSTSLGTFERPRDRLVIGLAPGGTIVLWIMNQIGNEIEVARFQANEIEGDPSEYEAGTQRYLDEHGPYLEKHGIPTEGW